MSVTNLPFCHCSQLLLLSPNPKLSSSSQTAKLLTLRNGNPTTHFAISCKTRFSSSSRASMASPSVTDTETKPFSVLFVCLGNICRSPAAEGVFTDLVNKSGLNSKFKIDSAGTINYHEGNEADSRMRAASKRRGIQITSISRPIKPSDFVDFDLILAMDKQNKEDILEAFNSWKGRHSLPDDAHKKVKLMCSYCKKHDESEVRILIMVDSKGLRRCWICLKMLADHYWKPFWQKTNMYKNPNTFINSQNIQSCGEVIKSLVFIDVKVPSCFGGTLH